MLNLKLASILEANKLSSAEGYLALLEIHLAPDTDADEVVYLANYNEDIIFHGNTYIAFSFTLKLLEKQAQGQLPTVTLQVSNVNRMMESQLQQYGGGVDASVRLTVLNTADPSGDPELETDFTITGTSCNEQWCTFNLGAPNPLLRLYPSDTYTCDHCRHIYNTPDMQAALDPLGAPCGYEGPLATCSQTLEGDNGCRAHNNVSAGFGGFPGINTTGLRLASPI